MEIVKGHTGQTTTALNPQALRRRRRTALGQLRLQAERRRLGANIFMVVSLIGVAAFTVGLALLLAR